MNDRMARLEKKVTRLDERLKFADLEIAKIKVDFGGELKETRTTIHGLERDVDSTFRRLEGKVVRGVTFSIQVDEIMKSLGNLAAEMKALKNARR